MLAVVFSSAGPVYVWPLYGDATFVPLIERLNAQNAEVPIGALEGQAVLWHGYIGKDVYPLGITAFPSLHIYLMVVLACAAFRASRWLGLAMVVVNVMILIGSVHLAWHYAVDGLAGIILGIATWWACVRFAGWWLARMPIAAMPSGTEALPHAAEISPPDPGSREPLPPDQRPDS